MNDEMNNTVEGIKNNGSDIDEKVNKIIALLDPAGNDIPLLNRIGKNLWNTLELMDKEERLLWQIRKGVNDALEQLRGKVRPWQCCENPDVTISRREWNSDYNDYKCENCGKTWTKHVHRSMHGLCESEIEFREIVRMVAY